MNEEERKVASRRFENRLRELDAQRLKRPARGYLPAVGIAAVAVLYWLIFLLLQGGSN